MSRSPNIKDMENHRRRRFHNPLFNVLTEEFDNVMLEKNLSDQYILDNFYVDERTGEGITNERIYSLFRSKPQNVNNSNDLLTSFNDYPGLVYLLLGKKGTGKTITLKHFSSKIESEMEDDEKMHLIYLDLKTKKTDQLFIDNLPESIFEEIFFTIKRKIKKLSGFFEDPEKIKLLDKSFEYFSVEERIKFIFNNKSTSVEFLLNYLSECGHNIYLIIDNVDDFPVNSVKRMVDKCIDIKNKYRVKCIVALRDYWSPQNLNIDDTNLCSLYLTKPNVFEIIKKRLDAINLNNVKDGVKVLYGGQELVLSPEGIINTFNCVVEDIVSDKDLHDKIYRLANYDTREHLFNMYYFFHSPYLYSKPMFIGVLIKKIKEIDGGFDIEQARRSKFFDFIECFMAIHSLCYDISSSKIFNIFYHEYQYDEGYDYRNTLIYIRILQLLPDTKIAMNKEWVIEKLVSVGYNEKALRDAIGVLLKKALIESVQGVSEESAYELSISEKGLIYISELIYEYSYILFVSDATPMPDKYKEEIREKFGDEDIPISRGVLTVKHRSVIKFIEFIESEEKEEMDSCHKDYKSLLKRICYGTMTSNTMREYTDHTMSKMAKFGKRKTKKIDKVVIAKI